MLYWIWFGAFVLVGCFFGRKAIHDKDGRRDLYGYSAASMLAALVINWERFGRPVFDRINSNVPNNGEVIHDITVLFLVGTLVTLFVLLPGLGIKLIIDYIERLAWRSSEKIILSKTPPDLP